MAHQVSLRDAVLSSKGLGVLGYHGMGLGKTFSSLLTARVLVARLKQQFPSEEIRVLAICPKSAIVTWRQEIGKFAPDLIKTVIPIPYTQLSKFVMRASKSNFKYAMVILDECHYIKNPEAQRTKNLLNLLQVIAPNFGGKILPMTGTPMPNDASEMYVNFWLAASPNINSAIHRILDVNSFEKFRLMFTEVETVPIKRKSKTNPFAFEYSTAVKYKGLKNDANFHQLVSPYIHYRKQEDCFDLPESMDIPIKLDLKDDDLLKAANVDMPDAYMSKLEKISTAKTPYAIAWIKEFLETGNQLIVFSMFTKTLRVIEQSFRGKIKLITGAESQTERAAAIVAFQQGKLQALALSYGAGAESLNLQNCTHSLFLNFPWHDDKLEQAKKRTHRKGQTKKTHNYFLFSGENDYKCYARVLEKRAFNENFRDRLRNDYLQGRVNSAEALGL